MDETSDFNKRRGGRKGGFDKTEIFFCVIIVVVGLAKLTDGQTILQNVALARKVRKENGFL